MLRALFLCFNLLLFAITYAQEVRQFRYNKLGENVGLSTDFVYNATQDATGQMWFATQNGLYTYDNKYFTHYAAPKIEGRNLDNILYGVYYDKKTNLILCSSLSAIMYFDPVKRQFLVPDYSKKAITELADNQPLVFYRDKRGNMWYGTQKKGLGLWNEKTQTVNYITEPINGTYPRVIDMVEPIAGTIWVSTTFGLYEVNANLKPVLHKADKGLTFINLAADTLRNCLWMGSAGKGLFRFDLKTKQFSNYKYPSYHEGNWVNDGIFISLQFLNATELLIEGSLLFNTVTNTFSPIKVEFPDFSFTPSHVERTIKDQEGNLWFCTYGGLYQMAAQNQHLNVLQVTNPANEFGIEIEQTVATNNHLYYWISDFQGILAYDIVNKQKKKYPLNIGLNFKVYAMCKYGANHLWLSTNRGVFSFNLNLNTYSKVKLNLPENTQNNIINMFVDKQQNLFLTAAQDGLFVYRHNRDSAFKKAIDLNKLGLYYVSAMSEDQLGNVWCVSPDGLFQLNISTLQFHRFYGKVTATGNPIRKTIDLICDNKNHIWFTDFESGISEFWLEQGKANVINHSTKPEFGVATHHANGLVLDSKNHLWVATLDGLLCIDLSVKRVKALIRRNQGLLNNSVERQLCIINNILVVPDWSKYCFLNLNEFRFNTTKPKLILSNIKIGELRYPFLNATEFYVPYNNGFISLNVGSTSYSNGQQNTYYYQMEGIDKLPQKMGINYLLSYSGLAPGRYVLKIWVENSNLIKSDITEIVLVVRSPFYKTWWFLLGALLLVGATVYYIYNQRVKSVKKAAQLRAEYSQKLAETEMKALRAQMNPHFMFNAMNSIQKYILKNEPTLASMYLTKFSRLIRVILEQSQKKSVSISEELELLELYTDLEKMRFDSQFEVKFTFSEGLVVDKIQIPTMILQPYVENAIWHGLLHKKGEGFIHISFEQLDKNLLKVCVTDNGVGRAKAKELGSKSALKSKSFGMQITHDRLDLLGQTGSKVAIVDLMDDTDNPCGTRIEIMLPVIEKEV